MDKKYTRDQIKDAIWQELKESDYAGENNERAYEVIGIVMAGIDKIAGEAQTGAVWVKASDRLPGYEIPVKWRDGNDHTHATNGKIPLIHMAKPFLTGWEWYDESDPSGERESDAVAFAEWCTINYIKVKDGGWVKDFASKDELATAQLYDIFKQQKEG